MEHNILQLHFRDDPNCFKNDSGFACSNATERKPTIANLENGANISYNTTAYVIFPKECRNCHLAFHLYQSLNFSRCVGTFTFSIIPCKYLFSELMCFKLRKFVLVYRIKFLLSADRCVLRKLFLYFDCLRIIQEKNCTLLRM